MTIERPCLACYLPLEIEQKDFHPACSMRVFGSTQPPEFPFDRDDLDVEGRHIVLGRMAVTGVQPKLSLDIEKGKGTKSRRFTIVGLGGPWGEFILKPPTPSYAELPENEDLVMHLAQIAQIETAQHSLIRMRSGELAYITRRFDRASNKAGHLKFQMEDMCQLTERLTEDKYKGSLEQIGKVIKRYSSNPGIDCLRFYELAMFCALVRNADMHLKNFSLLTIEGITSLSPAYDLISTPLALDDKDETALTVNGKQRNIKPKDWRTFGESLKIRPEALNASNEQLRESIPAMFAFIAKSFLSEERKVRLREIITERASQLFET